MIFYPGLHQPSDAKHFTRCCISVKRLNGHRLRSLPLGCPHVLLDSGAFTELAEHGHYRSSVATYANEIKRLHSQGVAAIDAAVTQDWMCEPFMLAKTGLTVADHQRLTISRYDELHAELNGLVPLMPVLQGYTAHEYLDHLDQYGDRLAPGAWVGVGSVCKRNTEPMKIFMVLDAIASRRPDLRLHGFGVKTTALGDRGVRQLLHSADSMAWSYNARRNSRNRNCWREAKRFTDGIEAQLS